MTKPPKAYLGALILWHLLALAAIAFWLPELKFHLPFWKLKSSEYSPFLILLASYAGAALLPMILSWIYRPPRIAGIFCAISALFGIVFFYFLASHVESTRVFMAEVFAAALVSVPLAWQLRAWRWLGVAALSAAALGGIAISVGKETADLRALIPHVDSTIERTAFYNVKITSYVDYTPVPAVRGGGLTRIGDQYLLLTGDGFLYLLGWTKDSDAFSAKPLPFRVPVNGEEFAKDTTGGPWRWPREGDALGNLGEDAGSQVIAWWFRTTGILVQEKGDTVRLFVSHYYWKHDTFCWVVRVSLIEGSRDSVLRGDPTLRWRTLFETAPCLPIKGKDRRRGTPFCGHFGGGRMVQVDDDRILLTVGDFGFNGVASKQLLSQDTSGSYGKTMMIRVSDGRAEIYTLGHRNPQGLYRDPDGKIWETEDGPQGGDELNLLKGGFNYGWPIVTYGVDYGTFSWPLNPHNGDHEGFEAPYYAWIPDIGVSNLVGVEKDLFPVWKHDLLISSLGGNAVYRTRIRNERVVYTEQIPIKKRIRDIAEGADGRIVLWCDDDNSIVSMRPLAGNSDEAAFASACSGCHKVGDGTSHRIGPDLWGVVGRGVASASGYGDYSRALRAYGGRWSEDRLDHFIANPMAAVPGTAMEYAGVSDPGTRSRIIEYLKNAKKVEQR